MRAYFSRFMSEYKHGADPQGVSDVSVKKVEWFKENSHITAAFYASKTSKLLPQNDASTYFCYLEDGRIFERLARTDKWKEVYPNPTKELLYNSILDKAVLEAKNNGMRVERHPYDDYTGAMNARRWLLWNGSDEQVKNLDTTHPIPDRTTVTFDKTDCDPEVLKAIKDARRKELKKKYGAHRTSGRKLFY